MVLAYVRVVRLGTRVGALIFHCSRRSKVRRSRLCWLRTFSCRWWS